MFTLNQLFQILDTLIDQPTVCIAYSGGLDSQVLLHAMSQLAKRDLKFTSRAVHINHGLNPKADEWEKHCANVCKQWGIDFVSRRIHLDRPSGDSLEAVARAARYESFAGILKTNECLITAHTKNDQAETLLLQLMRGAGVKGLAAMPVKKVFAKSSLIRPLLTFTRDELKEYAEKNDLVWVEDDSNLAMRFDRNYIRHQVLPHLQARWPQAFTTLTRSAQHCADSVALIEELADIDLQSVSDDNKKTLNISALLALSDLRQRNVLRRWISANGYQLPNAKQLTEIIQTVVSASEDAQPYVAWNQAEVRRFQNRLYIMQPLKPHDAAQIVSWDLQAPLMLPNDLGEWCALKEKGRGIISTLDINKITVRFRQGGERCQPAGRKETHALKNLMQEWKIPPWQRDRVPLLYCHDVLIAVMGYCICEGFAVKENEIGYTLHKNIVGNLG